MLHEAHGTFVIVLAGLNYFKANVTDIFALRGFLMSEDRDSNWQDEFTAFFDRLQIGTQEQRDEIQRLSHFADAEQSPAPLGYDLKTSPSSSSFIAK